MDDVALRSTSRSARPGLGALLLAALAPVSMLAVVPSGWYPFGPVKWLAVSVLVAAGSALVLRSGEVRLPRSIRVAVTMLLAALAVGAVVGLDPLYAWIGTPERRFGFVTWCLCAAALAAGSALVSPSASGPRQRRPEGDAQEPANGAVASAQLGPSSTLMAGLVLAGLGVGAVATAEALGWEPEVLQAGGRLTATFGSAAYLGAAAALLLPACLGAALDRRTTGWWRGSAIAAAPLLIVALLGSGARAAWVGTTVATLAVLVASRPWRAVTRPVIVAVALGLVSIAAGLVVLTPVGDRLGSLNDADAPGGQGRIDEWRIAARALADHPIAGVGPEGYRIAFADAVDADYQRAHGRDQQPDRAHAAPLDVALAGGLPALAAWFAVMALFARAAWRALTRGSPMLAGLAAGLVAHWSGQLFLFPLVELEPLAWLLAGTLVAATGSTPEPAARRCQERPRNDAGTPPQANLRRLVAMVSTERRRFDAGQSPGSATPGELATSSRHDDDRKSQVRRRSIAGSAAPGEPATSSRRDVDRMSQVRRRSTAGDATPGEPATSGRHDVDRASQVRRRSTAGSATTFGRQLAPTPGLARERRVASGVLGIVAAVALVSGITELVADQRAGEAADALGRGDPRSAADLAAAAVDLRPDVVRLHLLTARAAVADEQGTLAGLDEVEAALGVSPGDPIARREKVRLLVARARATQVPGHAEAAARELDVQLERDPYNAELWRQQALLAELNGDEDLQQRAERRSADLTPPDSDDG